MDQLNGLKHEGASSKGPGPQEALALCCVSWDLGSESGQSRIHWCSTHSPKIRNRNMGALFSANRVLMGGTGSSKGGNGETDQAWHLVDKCMGPHMAAHWDVPPLGPVWSLPKVKSVNRKQV